MSRHESSIGAEAGSASAAFCFEYPVPATACS
jgi:hypothetical protein